MTDAAGGPFVGRERELTLLRAALTDAHAGRSRFVLLHLVDGTSGGARASTSWVPPPTIDLPIAHRLEALSEEDRVVLRTAAVIGRDFSRQVLARAAPPAAALARATAIRLPEPAVSAGRSRFTHALIRESLHAESEPADRAALLGRTVDLPAAAITTGRSCSYRPRVPVTWEL